VFVMQHTVSAEPLLCRCSSDSGCEETKPRVLNVDLVVHHICSAVIQRNVANCHEKGMEQLQRYVQILQAGANPEFFLGGRLTLRLYII
jgi:hypothetical protein